MDLEIASLEKYSAIIYNPFGEAMDDKADKIKKIPYGETDYEAIQTENSYYVDKTMPTGKPTYLTLTYPGMRT